jgi:hypothetical protein
MRHFFHAVCLFLLAIPAFGQTADSLNHVNKTPADRADLMRQLMATPCGIRVTDSKAVVLQKINAYVAHYQPNPAYAEDRFSLAAVRQALTGALRGGYGIGAVLTTPNSKRAALTSMPK